MGRNRTGKTPTDATDWRRLLQAANDGQAAPASAQRTSCAAAGGSAGAPAWLQRLDGVVAAARADGPAGVVILLVDCSDSMAGKKLEQAKSGARDFAKQAAALGYGVSLARFSNGGERIVSWRQGESALSGGLDRLFADGGTNMAGGLCAALAELGDLSPLWRRVICLVTDGMPNDRQAALTAAEVARKHGIDIMCIGTDDADLDFLARIATCAGLARKVEARALRAAVADMALLLPKP